MWCISHIPNVRFDIPCGDNLLDITYANVRPLCYTSSIRKVKKVLTKKGIQNEFTI